MRSWKYKDVDPENPLTAMRIPVIRSCYPDHPYVAAVMRSADEVPDGVRVPSFTSSAPPDVTEAQMIASYIDYHITSFLGPYARQVMLKEAFDADDSLNGTVFIKYGEGDWGYRRNSWDMGSVFMPQSPEVRDADSFGPLTLEQVMDHAWGNTSSWVEWKSKQAEVFNQN